MIFAFDFETYLIGPARQVPPAVCMSYACDTGVRDVVTAQKGISMLAEALQDPDVVLVGANTAFDVLVSVFSAPDWREMLSLWVKAYEAGRVSDVIVRQKLLDLAHGCYRGEVVRGKWKRYAYSLDGVSSRHLDLKLDKSNPWRLRFANLEGVEPHDYPKEAYDYALGDAVSTLRTYQKQSLIKEAPGFPGLEPLRDEAAQVRGCLPLKAMSAYGLRTTRAPVEAFALEVEELAEELKGELVKAKLVKRTISRNIKGLRAYCSGLGLDDPYKKTREASGDPLLAKFEKYRSHAEELEAAGLVSIKYTRDTKAAAARMARAFKALKEAPPVTDSGAIALDADACERSQDPLLLAYSEYVSLSTVRNKDLPVLRAGSEVPLHTRFEEILQTGRTSSSGPNVQNVRRLPGIRECFTPRPGHVYVDADYPMLELHTLAQVCSSWFGFSQLADALKAGDDPHLRMASTILGITYEEAKARRAAGDAEVDNARTAGKGVNFGAPGGLGKKTFAAFAWQSYGIRLTEKEAAQLIKLFKETWPEIARYFARIETLKKGTGHNVVHLFSGRLRAGASYCAACNSPFQGLGSDIQKRALWYVFKACAGVSELGESDPLYGSKPVNQVHDSIMLETPEGSQDSAGRRLCELMRQAAIELLPDVGMREIDVVACKQWSKLAQEVRNEDGSLGVWCIFEAAREELKKAGDLDALQRAELLRKKKFPDYVAREALGEAS